MPNAAEMTSFFSSSLQASLRSCGRSPIRSRRLAQPYWLFMALACFWVWHAGVGATVALGRSRRLPSQNPGRTRWLNRGELDAWLPTVPSRLRPFFLALLHTGMRFGEALGITWGDVYLSESRITIGASSRVKTEASNRDVPINSTLADVLVAHARDIPHSASDPVFPKPEYRYTAMRRAFMASVRAARIKPARLHDLRHTYAVHAVQSGVPIPRLQRLMGHASIITTLRYAAHAPDNYFAEDAGKVETAMGGGMPRESAGSTSLRIA